MFKKIRQQRKNKNFNKESLETNIKDQSSAKKFEGLNQYST